MNKDKDEETVALKSAAVQNEIELSFGAFRDMALNLYGQVASLRQRHEYEGILCPLRGGFYLSDFLSRRLQLPVSYIHIASYTGYESGDFKVYFKPELQSGRRYLLCDDILATGRTAATIQGLFPDVDFDAAFLYRHRQWPLPFERTVFARQVDEWVWVRFPWEDESIEF